MYAVTLRAIKGARRLVLVEGVFAPNLSDLDGLEQGLTIRTLRDVLDAGDAALQAQLAELQDTLRREREAKVRACQAPSRTMSCHPMSTPNPISTLLPAARPG